MYFLGLLGERHEEKEESLYMVCKRTVNSTKKQLKNKYYTPT